jgi:hypothetical protein
MKHSAYLFCVATLFVGGCSQGVTDTQETAPTQEVIASTDEDLTSTSVDGPTWILGANENLFVVAHVQRACDIIRQDSIDAHDNPAKLSELIEELRSLNTKYGLDADIASGKSEPSTYVDIWIGVDVFVEHYDEFSDDWVRPMSSIATVSTCERWNFTEENSRWAN